MSVNVRCKHVRYISGSECDWIWQATFGGSLACIIIGPEETQSFHHADIRTRDVAKTVGGRTQLKHWFVAHQ